MMVKMFMAFLIKSWDSHPQDNVFHLSRVKVLSAERGTLRVNNKIL